MVFKHQGLTLMFPPYRRLAGFEKIIVGFGEMFAAEEAGIGGVGGGVRGF